MLSANHHRIPAQSSPAQPSFARYGGLIALMCAPAPAPLFSRPSAHFLHTLAKLFKGVTPASHALAIELSLYVP